jgi:hypothetical protein
MFKNIIIYEIWFLTLLIKCNIVSYLGLFPVMYYTLMKI